MMQDCTHIRELEGSRTLLTWDKTDFVGNTDNNSNDKSLSSEAAEEVMMKNHLLPMQMGDSISMRRLRYLT